MVEKQLFLLKVLSFSHPGAFSAEWEDYEILHIFSTRPGQRIALDQGAAAFPRGKYGIEVIC